MPNTSFHSFLFTIPNWHFSPAVKITVPYEINIRYALHWNKKVDVEGYTIKPGMAQIIANWQKLDDEIKAAAENNSRLYRAPGDWMSKQVPEEIPHPSLSLL